MFWSEALLPCLLGIPMSLSQKSSDFIDLIRECLSPIGRIVPYGSHAAGISTIDSDIDLALIVTDGYDFEDLSQEVVSDIINRVLAHLRQYKAVIRNVYDAAKVPLVRASLQGQNFDIALNACGGVIGTWLIQDLVRDNPRAVKVLQTVKEWAKANEVLGADKSRLGSHALTVFTLHYLITVGVVGLPHLENDEKGRCRSPIWTSQELSRSVLNGANMYGPRDNLWWIGGARRRNPRFGLSFKQLVRGVFVRLNQALSDAPQSRQIYSITTRARIPVSEILTSSPPLLYIEDPILRHNTASNLKPGPCDKLRAEVWKALTFLRKKGTVTSRITEKAVNWAVRE